MATTLSDLRTISYNILREEQDSSAYPVSLIDLMINSAQLRICNGTIVNPLTKEEVRKGQLPFLNSEEFYSNVAGTGLTADTTVGATSLSVTDASNFPSTGYLYISGNIITYTGKTATSFTGVTGVSFAFDSGTSVSIAFALPTDYSTPINATYNNRFFIPSKQFDDIFEDLNQYKGNNYNRNASISYYDSPYRINPFYTIKDNSYIIIFNINDTDGMLRFRYEKTPTTMTAITDTSIIDNDIYAQSTIPYFAVGEMLYNRGEEQRAAEIINFACGQIKEMYNHYNKTGYQKMSGVQYKTGKGNLNI